MSDGIFKKERYAYSGGTFSLLGLKKASIPETGKLPSIFVFSEPKAMSNLANARYDK